MGFLLVGANALLRRYLPRLVLRPPAVLRMWLAPLGFWSLFIFSLGWTMLCLNTIMRKAWMDHTRLSFPIVRLPLVLTGGDGPAGMLGSRVLWVGFAATSALSLLNGLHEWFPTLHGRRLVAHRRLLPRAGTADVPLATPPASGAGPRRAPPCRRGR